MNNEELNKIIMKAENDYESMKDRLHELYEENKTQKQTIEYAIEKLYKLRIQAEWEDRIRGKKRWVSKVSAYQDLINLLEGLYESN